MIFLWGYMASRACVVASTPESILYTTVRKQTLVQAYQIGCFFVTAWIICINLVFCELWGVPRGSSYLVARQASVYPTWRLAWFEKTCMFRVNNRTLFQSCCIFSMDHMEWGLVFEYTLKWESGDEPFESSTSKAICQSRLWRNCHLRYCKGYFVPIRRDLKMLWFGEHLGLFKTNSFQWLVVMRNNCMPRLWKSINNKSSTKMYSMCLCGGEDYDRTACSTKIRVCKINPNPFAHPNSTTFLINKPTQLILIFIGF